MSKLWTVAAVVACSVAFHLKGITAPPLDYHYHRQTQTASIARDYFEQGAGFLHPHIDWDGPPTRGHAATEFPLYMWLMGALWPVFGLGDVWGRLLSTAFSAAGAVYLYLFLERKLSAKEALAASLVYSMLPVQVYFGRTIQPEALAMAGSLASLYHWDRFLDEDSDLQWSLAVLASFLAIAHKLPYAYMLLVLACMAYLKKGWAAFKDHAVLVAPVLTAAAVYSWYRYAGSGAYVVPTHPVEFLRILDYGRLPYFAQYQLISRLPELGATWPGMVFAVLGARWLWKRGERLAFLWWAAVALHLIAGGGYSFYHEYTALPWAPVMAAFVGVGLVGAWERSASLARPAAAKAAVAAVALAIPANGLYRIERWYGQSFPFLPRAEQAADAVSAPDDLFVCNQRAPSLYLYFLHRRGWSWSIDDPDEPGLPGILDKARLGARFFATAADDLSPQQRSWVESRFALVYDEGGLQLYRLDGRRPAVDLLGLARPLPRRR